MFMVKLILNEIACFAAMNAAPIFLLIFLPVYHSLAIVPVGQEVPAELQALSDQIAIIDIFSCLLFIFLLIGAMTISALQFKKKVLPKFLPILYLVIASLGSLIYLFLPFILGAVAQHEILSNFISWFVFNLSVFAAIIIIIANGVYMIIRNKKLVKEQIA